MNYRKILYFVLIAIVFTSNTRAGTTQIAPNVYVSGIPTPKIALSQTSQIEPEWCWAASIQTILRYYGCASVTQQEIVNHVFGGVVNSGASNAQIYNALQFTANVNGTVLPIQSAVITNASQLIGFLDRENPVLLAYQHPQGGHAVVCTAVTYVVGPAGPQIIAYTVRDPWPYSAPKQTWNMSLLPQQMPQFPYGNRPAEITVPPPGAITMMIAVWF